MALGELLETYRQILGGYDERGVSTVRDPDDKENPAADESPEQAQQYFDIGRAGLDIVIGQLVANHRQPPATILDFPSGSGRVTRHLRAAFPDARIGACDLYESHVDFCVSEFAAEAVYSREDLEEVDIDPEWDVVFVGSLLTHLPKRHARQALRLIRRSLSPQGIAIVTLEGRRSIAMHHRGSKFVPDDRFKRIVRGYRTFGFGFSQYQPEFGRFFPKQASYGLAIVRPDWTVREVLKLPDVRLLGYAEGGWNDHQDYVTFGRPGATDFDQ
jgi:hypothetical protein